MSAGMNRGVLFIDNSSANKLEKFFKERFKILRIEMKV